VTSSSVPGPLEGRVALVTGGGRGLGRAVALALGRAGCAVAVTGRSPEPLDATVADLAGRGLALPGDATQRSAVEQAVRRTTAELGPIDLLVANAGRFATGGPVWESDPDDWWRDIEVNLRGPLLAFSAVLPGMVERGSGHVVAVGSGFGNRPYPHASAYSSSKAAVSRLVEAAGAELAGTGVVALVASPGFVETQMTRGFPPGFTAAHPEFADPGDDRWTPPDAFAGLVVRIAQGELDALSGRFVHVTTDVDQAIAAAAADDRPGTLRLAPYDG
jgi:NAD(P)-dependent dehydrogenase (short-subunit alcohol dehydrogenase family)